MKRRRNKDATFGMVLTVAVLIAGGMYLGRMLVDDNSEAEGVFVSPATAHAAEDATPAPRKKAAESNTAAARSVGSNNVTMNMSGNEPGNTTAQPVVPNRRIVGRGDTVSDIAKEAYGSADPRYIKLIVQANPSLRNPDSLSVGDELVIPPKPQSQPAASTTAEAPAESTGTRSHVVKPGESFWDIAQMYYGKGYLYKKILAANPDINASRLRPGTKLTIPPLKQ